MVVNNPVKELADKLEKYWNGVPNRILYLDDEQVRFDWALKNYPNHNIFWARNVCELHVVSMGVKEWDLISLDHDFGSKQEELCGDGVEAIRRLISLGIKTRILIIHSMNPVGANRMYELAKTLGASLWDNVYKIPFNATNYPVRGN